MSGKTIWTVIFGLLLIALTIGCESDHHHTRSDRDTPYSAPPSCH